MSLARKNNTLEYCCNAGRHVLLCQKINNRWGFLFSFSLDKRKKVDFDYLMETR
jgi:hypothetical protein